MSRSALLLMITVCLTAAPLAADPIYRGMGLDVLGATDEKLDTLAATGANAVRVQYYNYEADTNSEEEYRAWVDTVLSHLPGQLNKVQAHGMKAVIVLSAPPGGRDEIARPPVDRIFTPGYEWAGSLLVETWGRIAEIANSHPAVFGYQIMSEPAAPRAADWKALAARIVEAVRAAGSVAPALQPMVIIPSIYGNTDLVSSILVPGGEGRYAISVSFYNPWAYTHQGVYNDQVIMYPGCGAPSQISMARKNKKRKNKRQKRRKQREKDNKGQEETVNRCTPEGLAATLAKVRRFSLEKQLPVVVTEYSVAGWAPGGAQYLRDATAIFDAWGWHSFYNVWRGASDWSLEHDGTRERWERVYYMTDRLQAIEEYFRQNEF